MSRASSKLLTGASGAAGGGPVYAEDVFQTTLYTGTLNTYPNNVVNGMDFDDKGGLLWIKNRDQADGHYLYDTVRGDHKPIYSNEYYGQGDQTSQSGLAFNSNGFSVGDIHQTNAGGENFVAWNFLKQEKFFDIVSYTGDGTTNRQISHNLGSVPGMMLIKDLGNNNQSWYVYHVGAGNTHYGQLNSNGPFYDDAGPFNDTSPTSTVFTLGSPGYINTNGYNYIVYLFANNEAAFGDDEDEAIIKCGSYTGNGNATTGVTLDLGFEPQFMFIKNISTSSSWFILDNMRGMTVKGRDDPSLAPDLNAAEGGGNGSNQWSEPFATGIKMTAAGTATNANGDTHIYMAIRRPHKPASEFAATDLFTPVLGLNASANGKVWATTYPVDLISGKARTAQNYWYTFDRMRGGGRHFKLERNDAEGSFAYQDQFDHMDGVYTTTATSWTDWIGYLWRRAPGFFDVVAYSGAAGTNAVVKHNLGVVPEMVWRKRRDSSESWKIWASPLSGSGTSQANGNFYNSDSSGDGSGFSSGQYYAGDSQFYAGVPPTATQFTQGIQYQEGRTYITYLFASATGISKIGKYTGTGNNLNVDCGFSSGARFVLIKRSDASGGWYVWDSVRGIIAGNDPYLDMNTWVAEVTNTDYIDPLSSGFTVTSSAPAALNASGGTYLFYAVA